MKTDMSQAFVCTLSCVRRVYKVWCLIWVISEGAFVCKI